MDDRRRPHFFFFFILILLSMLLLETIYIPLDLSFFSVYIYSHVGIMAPQCD